MVRRGLDAFSHGDFDAATADMHEEIAWHVTFRLPDLPIDRDVYRGHDEVRLLWEAFRSVWDELEVVLEEMILADPERVVVRTRFVGRTSGIEVDRTVFYLFEIEDGLLRRLRPFDSEAVALAAAGTEPGAP